MAIQSMPARSLLMGASRILAVAALLGPVIAARGETPQIHFDSESFLSDPTRRVVSFPMSHSNIGLSEEISSSFVPNYLGPQLTFLGHKTGLPFDFTLRALNVPVIPEDVPNSLYFPGNFLIIGQPAAGGSSAEFLNDDDFEITFGAGSAVSGMSMFILGNFNDPAESLNVYATDGSLIHSFDQIATNAWPYFTGVTTGQPLSRISVQDDADEDNFAINDFQFVVEPTVLSADVALNPVDTSFFYAARQSPGGQPVVIHYSGAGVNTFHTRDDSTLIIDGGSVVAQLRSFENSHVTITDTYSNAQIHAYDDSTIEIQNGEFIAGDSIRAFNTAQLNIHGGTFTSAISLHNSASALITGGTFLSYLFLNEESTAVIQGGAIHNLYLFQNSNAVIQGGEILGPMGIYDDATLDIRGGVIDQARASFNADGRTAITFHGSDFRYDPELWVLSGTLESGQPFSIRYDFDHTSSRVFLNSLTPPPALEVNAAATIAPGDNLGQVVVSTPSGQPAASLTVAGGHTLGVQVQAGSHYSQNGGYVQDVTLQDADAELTGGYLTRLSARGQSQVRVEAGARLSRLELVDQSTLEMQGGSIGGDLLLYGQSTAQIGRGSMIGDDVKTYDQSRIDLSGATLLEDIRSYGQSHVTTKATYIRDEIRAFEQSTVRVVTTHLRDDLESHDAADIQAVASFITGDLLAYGESRLTLLNSGTDNGQASFGDNSIGVMSGVDGFRMNVFAQGDATLAMTNTQMRQLLLMDRAQVDLNGVAIQELRVLSPEAQITLHGYGFELLPSGVQGVRTLSGYWPHGQAFEIDVWDVNLDGQPPLPQASQFNFVLTPAATDMSLSVDAQFAAPLVARNVTIDHGLTMLQAETAIHNLNIQGDGRVESTGNLNVYGQAALTDDASLSVSSGRVNGQLSLQINARADFAHSLLGQIVINDSAALSLTESLVTGGYALQITDQASLKATRSILSANIFATDQGEVELRDTNVLGFIQLTGDSTLASVDSQINSDLHLFGGTKATLLRTHVDNDLDLWDQASAVVSHSTIDGDVNVSELAFARIQNTTIARSLTTSTTQEVILSRSSVNGIATYYNDIDQPRLFIIDSANSGNLEVNYIATVRIHNLEQAGHIEIAGGTVYAAGLRIPEGRYFAARGASVVHLFGFGFQDIAGNYFDGGLTGTWPDGSPLKISYLNQSDITANHVQTHDVDYNDDARIDAADIDALFAAFTAPVDQDHDLNGDALVDSLDTALLVQVALGTEFGDANLDKLISIGDLVLLAEHFNQSGGWAHGDFNGDGVVSIGDLTILAGNFGFGVDDFAAFGVGSPAALSASSTTAIPLPAAWPAGLALLGGLSLRRRGRGL